MSRISIRVSEKDNALIRKYARIAKRGDLDPPARSLRAIGAHFRSHLARSARATH